MKKTILLSRKEIAQMVGSIGLDRLMDESIESLASACHQYKSSAYSVPVRSGFSYNGDNGRGLLEWMPVLRYDDRVLVKLVGYHPKNPQQFGLPTVLSTVIMFDTRDGHPISIIDGTFLTSLRTGAASAVASSVLALPQSRVIGLIGAGAQAVTQLHALSRGFDFERILINDTDMSACNSFTGRAAYAGVKLPVEVCSIDDVMNRSDIVCTATSIDIGCGPLFEDMKLQDHIHINAVGSDFPGKVELPQSLVKRSLVCPDFLDQALQEGECQQLAPEEIGPELPVLIKQRDSFTRYQHSPTVFDSTGWALEDLIVAEIITSLAAEAGCGTSVDMQCVSKDPKNPYEFVDTALTEEERLATDEMMRA